MHVQRSCVNRSPTTIAEWSLNQLPNQDLSVAAAASHLCTKYQVSWVHDRCTTIISRCHGPPQLLVLTRMCFKAPSFGSLQSSDKVGT